MWWQVVVAAWIYTLICVVVIRKRWEKTAWLRVVPLSWIGPTIVTIGAILIEIFPSPVEEEKICWAMAGIIVVKGAMISAWLIWFLGLRGLALYMAPFFSTAQQLALNGQWKWWWLGPLMVFIGHIGLAIIALIELKELCG